MRQIQLRTSRWSWGGIYWAENDLCRMAYVVTNDPSEIGTVGLEGVDDIYVVYISPEQAEAWS